MLISVIKESERLYEKLGTQEKKYNQVIQDLNAAIKVFNEKVNNLDKKSELKKQELEAKITELESEIAVNVFELEDPNLTEKLKTKAIELDIHKKQKTALTANKRRTIIINSKKEIDKINALYQEAIYQFEVLTKLYQRFFKVVQDAQANIEKLKKEKTELFNPVYSAIVNNTISGMPDMQMRGIVEYYYDTDIKVPGEVNSLPAAHEMLQKWHDDIRKKVYIEAQNYAENL
jgi:chromosome segregation ATPase